MNEILYFNEIIATAASLIGGTIAYFVKKIFSEVEKLEKKIEKNNDKLLSTNEKVLKTSEKSSVDYIALKETIIDLKENIKSVAISSDRIKKLDRMFQKTEEMHGKVIFLEDHKVDKADYSKTLNSIKLILNKFKDEINCIKKKI